MYEEATITWYTSYLAIYQPLMGYYTDSIQQGDEQ